MAHGDNTLTIPTTKKITLKNEKLHGCFDFGNLHARTLNATSNSAHQASVEGRNKQLIPRRTPIKANQNGDARPELCSVTTQTHHIKMDKNAADVSVMIKLDCRTNIGSRATANPASHGTTALSGLKSGVSLQLAVTDSSQAGSLRHFRNAKNKG